ncbi:MAG: BspA family leucine-rich repeat surface protein, partial [Pseudomonadales bacterium]|nr:BspA family leucine-rich repeat surface protein [Pseudomonadales bacterium]
MKNLLCISFGIISLISITSCIDDFVPEPDTTPPSIILNGDNTLRINVFDQYIEPGVYSTHDAEGSVDVVIKGDVDTSIVGNYELTYIATDLAGNQTQKIRSVQVVDEQKPIITLNGLANTTHSYAEVYVDPSAIVVDNYNTDLTFSVAGEVDETKLGTYLITYQSQDSSGNHAIDVFRTVTVLDDVDPIITLYGEQNITLERGDQYIELGATVSDNFDKNIDINIEGSVNPTALGSYLINYNAIDSFDNSALTLIRNIEVVDNTEPRLTLIGVAEVYIELLSPYTDLGITVENEIEGDYNITVTGEVTSTVVGEYFISYSVIDGSNNQTIITRTVTVQDTTKPVISNSMQSVTQLEYGSVYDHDNITVTDNYDESVGLIITGEVDTDTLGSYLLTYDAIDSSGNSALSYMTQLTIVDTTAPELVVSGPDIIEIYTSDTFVEPTASAIDGYDGLLDVSIFSNVNFTKAGSYNINYLTVDSSGNSSEVNKTVNVIQDNNPEITLNGGSEIIHLRGGQYIELGVITSDDRAGLLDVQISSDLNPNQVGEYDITYSVTDSANQTSNISRKVHVLDRPFITTWNVDGLGGSRAYQIEIPITDVYSDRYNYAVDWGDGNLEFNLTQSSIHSYSEQGNYQIKIYGEFARFKPAILDREKLLSVDQWGDITWYAMSSSFYDAVNMNVLATDAPDLSDVISLNQMFYNADSFNADLSHWDVSTILFMQNMFEETELFNQDLSSWNVSKVRDMSGMFSGAKAFNGEMFNWDVSNVTDMSYMFYQNNNFNQDISNWDVLNVTNMNRMFAQATIFDKNIGLWNVSQVKNMEGMLSGTVEFNQDIGNWDVSNVENMLGMFAGSGSFDQDISRWDVSNVIDMQQMFVSAVFNKSINEWDVGSVKSMYAMFAQAKNFNKPLNNWDVSSVEAMTYMFVQTPIDQDLSNWQFKANVNLVSMFVGAELSTVNYDNLLISMSNQILNNDIEFHGGNSQFTPNSDAQIARDILTQTFNWVIVDGGPVQIV